MSVASDSIAAPNLWNDLPGINSIIFIHLFFVRNTLQDIHPYFSRILVFKHEFMEQKSNGSLTTAIVNGGLCITCLKSCRSCYNVSLVRKPLFVSQFPKKTNGPTTTINAGMFDFLLSSFAYLFFCLILCRMFLNIESGCLYQVSPDQWFLPLSNWESPSSMEATVMCSRSVIAKKAVMLLCPFDF